MFTASKFSPLSHDELNSGICQICKNKFKGLKGLNLHLKRNEKCKNISEQVNFSQTSNCSDDSEIEEIYTERPIKKQKLETGKTEFQQKDKNIHCNTGKNISNQHICNCAAITKKNAIWIFQSGNCAIWCEYAGDCAQHDKLSKF